MTALHATFYQLAQNYSTYSAYNAATAFHGRIFLSSGAIFLRAISISYAACARSQYPSDSPKNAHKRKSVSAVMERLPRTIWPMRCAGTPISFARRYWEMPIGSKNSSFKSSPGVTGSRKSDISLHPLAMVVNYLHMLSIPILPLKNDSELVIDSNAVPTLKIALQRFETISWRNAQIVQRCRNLKLS